MDFFHFDYFSENIKRKKDSTKAKNPVISVKEKLRFLICDFLLEKETINKTHTHLNFFNFITSQVEKIRAIEMFSSYPVPAATKRARFRKL